MQIPIIFANLAACQYFCFTNILEPLLQIGEILMPLIAPESFICLVYVIVACIVGLLGLPMYFGKIPPNRFYGFRTARTLASPNVWYPVNRVSGGWMAVTGALTAAVATWAQREGWNLESAAVANLVVFSGGMLCMLLHSLRTLWRIK